VLKHNIILLLLLILVSVFTQTIALNVNESKSNVVIDSSPRTQWLVSNSLFPYVNKSISSIENTILYNAETYNWTAREDVGDVFEQIGEAIERLEHHNIFYSTCCVSEDLDLEDMYDRLKEIIELVDSIDTIWSEKTLSIQYYAVFNKSLGMSIAIAISDKFSVVLAGNGQFLYMSKPYSEVKNPALLNTSAIEKIMDKLASMISIYKREFTFIATAPNGSVFTLEPNITIIYMGLSGERSSLVKETKFKFVNGSIVPVTEYSVQFKNPYHLFYVLLNGVRINYPFKLGIEESDGKVIVKFFEGYIPAGIKDISKDYFNLTHNYLLKIVKLFNSATNGSYGLDDLVITDLFYSYTYDLKYFVPVLIVRAINTGKTATFYLFVKGPKLVHYNITFAGKAGSLFSPLLFSKHDLRILFENSLAYATMKQITMNALFVALIVVSISPLIIRIVKKYRLKKKVMKRIRKK